MKKQSVFAAAFAAVAIAAASSSAMAAELGFGSTKIVAIQISNFTNHAWVTLDQNAVGSPACVINSIKSPNTPSNTKRSVAFRIDNDKGRAYLSVLTAAYLAGKTVKGSTTGDCPFPEVNNIEGLAWLKVTD